MRSTAAVSSAEAAAVTVSAMDALAKTYSPGDYVHIIAESYAQWEVVTLRHGGDCILATIRCRIVNREYFDAPKKGDMREVDTALLEDCDH